MGKNIKLKDIYNRNYKVLDIENFMDHINKFHSVGTSIHEENGFFFKIDDSFRKKIKEYKK